MALWRKKKCRVEEGPPHIYEAHKMYPSCLSFRQECVSAFQILYAYIGAAFIIKYTCSADRANSTASGGAMSGEGLAATHKLYRSYIPFMTFLPS